MPDAADCSTHDECPQPSAKVGADVFQIWHLFCIVGFMLTFTSKKVLALQNHSSREKEGRSGESDDVVNMRDRTRRPTLI
jgi:hypothetical protein